MMLNTIDEKLNALSEHIETAETFLMQLIDAARPLRSAWEKKWDPGFYDLDDEQPVHVTLTKGEWKRLMAKLS